MSECRLFHVAVPGVVQSRAFRCLWLLEELANVDFEVCMLRPGEPYGQQMRHFGVSNSEKVPTLLLGKEEIGESGVISQVLAERFGASSGFNVSPAEKVELLQWVAMAETCITFRIPLLPKLMKGGLPSKELKSEVIEPMQAVFDQNTARFETHFQERQSEFLLASGFSIADTMCGWSLHTFHEWGIMDLAKGRTPLTLAYLERLRERPAFKLAEAYGETEPGLYARGCHPIR